jgi:hypothetical protein
MFYTLPRFLWSAVLVRWWNKRHNLSPITLVDSFFDSGLIRQRRFLRSLISWTRWKDWQCFQQARPLFVYLLQTVLSLNPAGENVIRFSSLELFWCLRSTSNDHWIWTCRRRVMQYRRQQRVSFCYYLKCRPILKTCTTSECLVLFLGFRLVLFSCPTFDFICISNDTRWR